MKRDNRIVVDLNKVQWARYYYRNQHGHCVNTIVYDEQNWFFSKYVHPDELAAYHPDYPGETLRERYIRRKVEHDKYVPELVMKVTANTMLTYTGDKAVALWEAWKEKVFAKDKKKKD